MNQPIPPGPVLVLLLALFFCGCLGHTPDSTEPATLIRDQNSVPQGSSQFVFNDSQGNGDRPVTVFIYRPEHWQRSGPVLIAMHGAGRNGADTRNIWISISERYNCLIVAPEFSSTWYPGDNMYIGGNLYPIQNSPGKPDLNQRSVWTYTAVEHLFDEVKKRTNATTGTYLLFGHSAGAQFVHRLVTFLPDARYSRAIAANAGMYLFPTYSVSYGLGLNSSPLEKFDLSRIFSRKLIILAGESDNNPNDTSMPTFPEAEAQGKTRLERAENYYQTAKAEADDLNVTLNWELHTVPGIGHDEGGMAAASVKWLFV